MSLTNVQQNQYCFMLSMNVVRLIERDLNILVLVWLFVEKDTCIAGKFYQFRKIRIRSELLKKTMTRSVCQLLQEKITSEPVFLGRLAAALMRSPLCHEHIAPCNFNLYAVTSEQLHIGISLVSCPIYRCNRPTISHCQMYPNVWFDVWKLQLDHTQDKNWATPLNILGEGCAFSGKPDKVVFLKLNTITNNPLCGLESWNLLVVYVLHLFCTCHNAIKRHAILFLSQKHFWNVNEINVTQNSLFVPDLLLS